MPAPPREGGFSPASLGSWRALSPSRTASAVKLLQDPAQRRSNWIWVPPVKSRPGRSGARMAGLVQQSTRPRMLRLQARTDPIQACLRQRLTRKRGAGGASAGSPLVDTMGLGTEFAAVTGAGSGDGTARANWAEGHSPGLK